MQKLRLMGVMVFAFLGLLLVAPQSAQAQDAPPPTTGCESVADRSILAFPTWDQYLERNDEQGCRIANFQFPQDLVLVLLALVDMMIRLSAFVAVGFIIYAGFKFMLAQGQPDRIAEARKIILDALIGLVIAIISVAIISFVAGVFS